MDTISPKYQMTLIRKISETIWSEYGSYADVLFYIKKWHKSTGIWICQENFFIYFKDQEKQKIDLSATLHNMDCETLLKIAVDLGIETLNFIPAIPIFRNEIKSDYNTASVTFEKAFKCIESDPATAIGLVNSALESIIKEILKDDRISVPWKNTDTLYSLTKAILSEFKFTIKDLPAEIKTINTSLLAASQAIEKLRSDKTLFHGKTNEDYIIENPIYVYFIVNSISSIGLFLISFYKQVYPPMPNPKVEDVEPLPF